MKYVLMLMLVLGLAMPGSAGQREDALIGDLLGLGARALDRAVAQPPAAAAPTPPAGAAAYAAPVAPAAAEPLPIGKALTATFKPALDELIEQYKEQYKEEGRTYARELGDKVVERVVRDPEINSTLTSLRVLCWLVVGYLTLVTLIMLGCLVYLKNAHARLLAEVRRMARSMKE